MIRLWTSQYSKSTEVGFMNSIANFLLRILARKDTLWGQRSMVKITINIWSCEDSCSCIWSTLLLWAQLGTWNPVGCTQIWYWSFLIERKKLITYISSAPTYKEKDKKMRTLRRIWNVDGFILYTKAVGMHTHAEDMRTCCSLRNIPSLITLAK